MPGASSTTSDTTHGVPRPASSLSLIHIYLDTLAALTSGVGPDVILEMLADKNLENDMRMIAKPGRIVVIGSRGSLEMTPRLLMAKESVVMGMAIWHSAPEEARMAEAAVAAALRSGACLLYTSRCV